MAISTHKPKDAISIGGTQGITAQGMMSKGATPSVKLHVLPSKAKSKKKVVTIIWIMWAMGAAAVIAWGIWSWCRVGV